MFIIGVLVLVSCQSTPYSKAYLPPLPKLEETPSFEKEPLNAIEILIDNYKKALEWMTIVWETNEGDKR